MISLTDAEYFYDGIFAVYQNEDFSYRKKFLKLYEILREFLDLLLINDSQYFSGYYAMLIYIIDKYRIGDSAASPVLKLRAFAAAVQRDRSKTPTQANINFAVRSLTAFIDCFTEPDYHQFELTEKLGKYRELISGRKYALPEYQAKEQELFDFTRINCISKEVLTIGDREVKALLFEDHEGNRAYLYLDRQWEDSFSYIRAGCILNLFALARNTDDGYLQSYSLTERSYIIFEPDYLVDITDIAECFNHSGANKYAHLLQKYEFQGVKYQMMKGNVINSYLDQLVDNPDIGLDDAYETAIRLKPIALFALAARYPEESKILKEETVRHFHNIRNKLAELQCSNILIEPSFISPAYGLQGRLDLMMEFDEPDAKSVIELKSGNPPDTDYSIVTGDNVRIRTGVWNNHSAQTTGYNLLLDSVYPRRSGSSGILYSALDYENLRNQPNVHANKLEFIRIRNWIAAIDYALSNDAGTMVRFMFRDNPSACLPPFKLDFLRRFQADYQRMDALTRDYFEAYSTFIAREMRTARTGESSNPGNCGQSGLWILSREEKEDSYNTVYNLTVDYENSDFVSYHIDFIRDGSLSPITTIRKGDIVILYPQADGYNIFGEQINKGYVKEISNETIRISLRNKQTGELFFRSYEQWTIELDSSDSILKKLLPPLWQFCRSTATPAALGLKPPRSGELPAWHDDRLNERKNRILNEALAAKDYYIIQGPPGTGKTSRMLRSLVETLYRNTNERILVAAYTNRAVDEICSRLKEITPAVEFYKLGSKDTSEHADCLIATMVEKESPRKVYKKVRNARIIVSTVASIIYNPEIFEIISFDTAIVDEASQILEPYMLPIINNVDRFILIGDEKQLPAIVTQDSRFLPAGRPSLEEIGLTRLDNSLFERLLSCSRSAGWPNCSAMLEDQARMHFDIQELANSLFYEGRLRMLDGEQQNSDLLKFSPDSGNELEKALSRSRIVFFDSSGTADCNSFKHNPVEAALAAELAQMIHTKAGPDFNDRTVGIIAPFRAQCAEIRSLLPKELKEAVTVDTIERYQGSERDTIIVSFAVNRPYELRTVSSPVNLNGTEVDRKLNVAITRAKKRLLMIGNAAVLSQSPVYRKMIEYIRENGGFVGLEEIRV